MILSVQHGFGFNEIKSNQEQSALIDSFESEEENKITNNRLSTDHKSDEIPSGVSIESASYMENNRDLEPILDKNTLSKQENEEEYTPKLFTEEQKEVALTDETSDDSDQLFDQDTNNEEEDFEIPAFLRRQKF